MDETKHTPGPWIHSTFRGQAVRFFNPKGQTVLLTRSMMKAADAHLIAAAPEMLQKLKEYNVVLPDKETTALIAKAEGR